MGNLVNIPIKINYLSWVPVVHAVIPTTWEAAVMRIDV
jgi:hypothetical protein